MKKTKRHHGFTIIELIVVVVVIGLLSSIAVFVVQGQKNRAFDVETRSDLNSVRDALELYYAYNNEYPGTKQVTCYDEGNVYNTGRNPYRDFIKPTLGLPQEVLETNGGTAMHASWCPENSFFRGCGESSSQYPGDLANPNANVWNFTVSTTQMLRVYCPMKKDATSTTGWMSCVDSTVDKCEKYKLWTNFTHQVPSDMHSIYGGTDKRGMYFSEQ